MSASVILVAVVISFFIFLTISVLEMERSYKANILGGLAVLWTVMVMFLLVVFFAGRNSVAAEPAQAVQADIQ